MGRKAKTPYMQMNLGDRFLALSKREQEVILNSRLGHFGDETFPRIDPDVLWYSTAIMVVVHLICTDSLVHTL